MSEATPAAPATPAAAVAAPELSAHEFFRQDDVELAKALNINLDPPAEEEGTPVLAALAEASPVSAPAKADPEIPVLTRKPMTEFAIFDDAGELEIPDVKIKFKAKGEDRELPLDHVVRLAQFGFANEEREQQVLAARKFVAEAETQAQDYQSTIQKYESHYDRLFNDPQFYENARLEYLQQNSPENRALRAEQQLQQVRQNSVLQQEDQMIQGFVQQSLVPTVQAMLTNNPLVNEQEILGRYTELTAPLLVRGRVPINRLQQVQRLVSEDLAGWVERMNFERQTKQTTATAVAAKQTQETATAKRQAARVFAHSGSAGAEMSQPAKPAAYGTAKDWLKSTFGTTND